LFARFVCGSETCANRAFKERGGPAGHRKKER